MNSIERVKQFHLTFGHPVADRPRIPSPELRRLRVRLLAEELIEFSRASGVGLALDSFSGEVHISPIDEPPNHSISIIEAADAIGDLDYVTNGAALVWGLPAEEIYAEVHRSNMSKAGPNGRPIYRQDGKILKGPDYTPPDIKRVIGIYDEEGSWPTGL